MVSKVSFDQLLEIYERNFPAVIENQVRDIGIEEELPLVYRDGQIGNFLQMADLIIQKYPYWKKIFDDINKDVLNGFDCEGDLITVDASCGTIEIATKPRLDLHAVSESRAKIISWLAEIANQKEMRILGYGIQPACFPRRKLWWPKGRYEVLVSQLPKGVDLATISASSQTHIKVSRSEVVDFTNVCCAFSGLMTILTSNSPIWRGKIDHRGRRAVRNTFWEKIAEADRVGVPIQPFGSFEDILSRLLKIRFFMYRCNGSYLKHSGDFINFVAMQPDIDLDFICESLMIHEACNWWDVRPRASFGTVETRMFCQQPPQDDVTVHALILGIACNLSDSLDLMKSFKWEDWRRLRENAQVFGLDSSIKSRSVYPILYELIEISERGLISRGANEEIFLEKMKERLEKKQIPSDKAIKVFQESGIPGLVDKFSYCS